jgi:hypothetical protein
MTSRNWNRVHLGIAIILIAALLLAVPVRGARADANSNPGVLPPNSQAFGKTYNEWAAAWWQYVESQAGQPITSATGAGCATGQSGPVFFLVGGGPAVRDQCTVPAGKALFFPLVNADWVHIPCTGQNASVCDPFDTAQAAWNELESLVQFRSFTALHATIDGAPVTNLSPATTPYRACDGPVPGCAPSQFSVTTPTTDIFGNPAGTYPLTVADGFYLLLTPLAPGEHTIAFGGSGSINGSPFSQDITYHLAVAG